MATRPDTDDDVLNTPEDVRELLAAHGLTFADCVRAFAADDGDPLVEAARKQHHCEGEIEIDQMTVRSGSDGPGDYVMAWVWVDTPEEAE